MLPNSFCWEDWEPLASQIPVGGVGLDTLRQPGMFSTSWSTFGILKSPLCEPEIRKRVEVGWNWSDPPPQIPAAVPGDPGMAPARYAGNV